MQKKKNDPNSEPFESLLDFDPDAFSRILEMRDKDSDEENENPQEESSTVNPELSDEQIIQSNRSTVPPSCSAINVGLGSRSTRNQIYQTMNHVSTSFEIDQNPSLFPPNRSETRLMMMMPREENLGFDGSLVTQFHDQRFTIPNHGSDQNYFNWSFGMRQEPPPMMWPNSFVVADPYGWRPQVTRQFMPNHTMTLWPAFVDHNYAPWRWRHHNTYQQYPMVTMPRPNQYNFQGPPFVVYHNHFNQYFGMQRQDQMVPTLSPVQVPMRPMMQQDQLVTYVVPGLPMMYNQEQNQIVPNLVPSQQNQIVPNLVQGQAPMRPMHQSVPNLATRQALMRPVMMYNQEQYHIAPFIAPNRALTRPTIHFDFPIHIIQDQEAAEVGLELDQQMQQLQPQTQQPTQSPGSDTGTDSD